MPSGTHAPQLGEPRLHHTAVYVERQKVPAVFFSPSSWQNAPINLSFHLMSPVQSICNLSNGGVFIWYAGTHPSNDSKREQLSLNLLSSITHTVYLLKSTCSAMQSQHQFLKWSAIFWKVNILKIGGKEDVLIFGIYQNANPKEERHQRNEHQIPNKILSGTNTVSNKSQIIQFLMGLIHVFPHQANTWLECYPNRAKVLYEKVCDLQVVCSISRHNLCSGHLRFTIISHLL